MREKETAASDETERLGKMPFATFEQLAAKTGAALALQSKRLAREEARIGSKERTHHEAITPQS